MKKGERYTIGDEGTAILVSRCGDAPEQEGEDEVWLVSFDLEQRDCLLCRRVVKPEEEVSPPAPVAEYNKVLGDLLKLSVTAGRAREHLAKERAVLRYALERLMKAVGRTLDARASGNCELANDDLHNAHHNAQLTLEQPSKTKEPSA